jgi:hypothetical protein
MKGWWVMPESNSNGGELVRAGETARVGVSVEVDGLSADQRTAMESLGTGVSVVETAKAMGIHRGTIYRWIKQDAAFAAAYNAWHESLQENCRGSVAMLLGKSAATLHKAVEGGDAKIALAILTKTRMLEKEKERNTDEEEIRREAAIAKKNRDGKLRRREAVAGSSLGGD